MLHTNDARARDIFLGRAAYVYAMRNNAQKVAWQHFTYERNMILFSPISFVQIQVFEFFYIIKRSTNLTTSEKSSIEINHSFERLKCFQWVSITKI